MATMRPKVCGHRVFLGCGWSLNGGRRSPSKLLPPSSDLMEPNMVKKTGDEFDVSLKRLETNDSSDWLLVVSGSLPSPWQPNIILQARIFLQCATKFKHLS